MAIENFLTSAVGLQQVWTGFGSRATYSAFSKQSTLFHEAEPAPACCSVLSGTRAHCWRVNGIVRAFQVGLQLPAKFVVWRRWRAESIIKWASGLFITYHEWAHFLPWAKRACISFEYFFFSKQSFKYFFIFYTGRAAPMRLTVQQPSATVRLGRRWLSSTSQSCQCHGWTHGMVGLLVTVSGGANRKKGGKGCTLLMLGKACTPFYL